MSRPSNHLSIFLRLVCNQILFYLAFYLLYCAAHKTIALNAIDFVCLEDLVLY